MARAYASRTGSAIDFSRRHRGIGVPHGLLEVAHVREGLRETAMRLALDCGVVRAECRDERREGGVAADGLVEEHPEGTVRLEANPALAGCDLLEQRPGAVGLAGLEVCARRGQEPRITGLCVVRRRECGGLLVERRACPARASAARRLGGTLELGCDALVRAASGEREVPGTLLPRRHEIRKLSIERELRAERARVGGDRRAEQRVGEPHATVDEHEDAVVDGLVEHRLRRPAGEQLRPHVPGRRDRHEQPPRLGREWRETSTDDVRQRVRDLERDPVRVGDADDPRELDRVERIAAAHRMKANEARPR